MMGICLKRFILLCTCAVIVFLSSCSGSPQIRLETSDVTVSVWQTTKDRTDLLAAKPDVKFANDDGADNPLTINIDETQIYQQIDGFGASITDYSADLIYNKMQADDRNQLMKELFDPVDGLGISLLRQPIGGSDFVVGYDRKNDYTYDDVPAGRTDPSLTGFSIAHDIPYIIPLLKQAIQINPGLTIFATPWSPPAWMKTNGSLIRGGSLIPEYYPVYAQYFVKYIEAYREQGIPVHYVTAQNEPKNAPTYPSMIMDAPSQNKFVRDYLAPALDKAGLSTRIAVYDNDWSDTSYPSSMLHDADTYSKVAGSAWHWYSGDPDAMGYFHRMFPNKDIWITEASGGPSCDGHPINQMASWGDVFDNTFKTLIIGGLQNWANGVIFWNLALIPPEEDWGCRGVVSISSETVKVIDRTQEYYILGHTSRFIKPGAVRIGADSYNSDGIMDVAFKNKDGSTVLLALNGAGEEKTIKVKWGQQAFSYTMPSGAVATFKWQGTPVYGSFDAGSRLSAVLCSTRWGVDILDGSGNPGPGKYAGGFDAGDAICFKNVNFHDGFGSAQLRFACGGKGDTIELRLDGRSGPLIGTCAVDPTGGDTVWVTANIPVDASKATGKHDLYLNGKGGKNIGKINWIKFSRGAGDRTEWTASATGQEEMNSAFLALDGDVKTKWHVGSKQSGEQSFSVDFGRPLTFNKVEMDCGSDSSRYFAGEYTVFVSNNGHDWGTPVATGRGDSRVAALRFDVRTARYIKIIQQKGMPEGDWAIAEFNIYDQK